MSKVIVRGAFHVEGGQPAYTAFDADYAEFRRQIERDVLVGTFDDYDPSIFTGDGLALFEANAEAAARCIDERSAADELRGIFGFRLELDAALFAHAAYGLQRLVHTLASDLFVRRLGGHRARVAIAEVDFGDLGAVIEATYRPNSHSRTAIRQAFALAPNTPLLAFSLKPRACLGDADYLRMAGEAFDGGCQIVELDTRDLVLEGAARLDLLERLSDLAFERSRGSRVCRFSANVSGPQRVVEPVLKRLGGIHAGRAPFVVKVDGNLDGLSTIQAIRAGVFGAIPQPIITCYPVLKYALQPALGPNAWVRMLAMSGADIIYPGQSPDFGQPRGRIDTESVARAQAHYRAMAPGDYPMLSVAGGIAINAVHATLSVLGSDIAFFAGGGIATSKRGIRAGAANFAEAIALARRDLFEQERIWWLENKLVRLSQIYFKSGRIPPEYELIRPKALKGLPDRVTSRNLEGA